MCWMLENLSTIVSIIPSCLRTRKITSMALGIFGIRRSGTCVNLMVYQDRILGYF